MEPTDTVRARALVSGRVQGVFFRASTLEEARSLGLQGWVRNLADGRVEFVAEGPQPAVDGLIRWAHTGPPQAHVDSVEVLWEDVRGDLDEFRIA